MTKDTSITNSLIAAKVLGCQPDNLVRYVFPKTYGSTSGPFGGIGGSAITTFIMSAYVSNVDGRAAIFCGDRFVKVSNKFQISVTF